MEEVILDARLVIFLGVKSIVHAKSDLKIDTIRPTYNYTLLIIYQNIPK